MRYPNRGAAALVSFGIAFALLMRFPHAAKGQGNFIPPGFDLLETETGTSWDLKIPARFFDPESQPFRGTIKLRGVPIGTFNGYDTGNADTVVRRKQGARLPSPFPSSAEVNIQLVALSLRSTQPISVRVEGATELWDVEATVSDGTASTGRMKIVKRDKRGGTFDASLVIYPLFKFVRRKDGRERILPLGDPALPVPPDIERGITVKGKKIPWEHRRPDGVLDVPGLSQNFSPGVRGKPRRVELKAFHASAHNVQPVRIEAVKPPPGGCAVINFDGDAGAPGALRLWVAGRAIPRFDIRAGTTDDEIRDTVGTALMSLGFAVKPVGDTSLLIHGKVNATINEGSHLRVAFRNDLLDSMTVLDFDNCDPDTELPGAETLSAGNLFANIYVTSVVTGAREIKLLGISEPDQITTDRALAVIPRTVRVGNTALILNDQVIAAGSRDLERIVGFDTCEP